MESLDKEDSYLEFWKSSASGSEYEIFLSIVQYLVLQDRAF